MILLLIAAVIISGCSENGTGPRPARLLGTWTFVSSSFGADDYLKAATVEFGTGSSFKFTNPGFQSEEDGKWFDVVESGTFRDTGTDLTLNINNQQPSDARYHTFRAGENKLKVSLSSGTLKLTGPQGYTTWRK